MNGSAKLFGNLFVRILLDVPHHKRLTRGAAESIDRCKNLFDLLILDELTHRRAAV